VVSPLIGCAVLAIPIWGDLRPGQAAPYNSLPWLAVALVALGVVYTAALSLTRPQALAQAPALLEGADSLSGDPSR